LRTEIISPPAGRKLQLVGKKEVKGAVYSMSPLNGKIVAGIGKKVSVFKWAASDEDGYDVAMPFSVFFGSDASIQVVNLSVA
jgi:hypothetical protein